MSYTLTFFFVLTSLGKMLNRSQIIVVLEGMLSWLDLLAECWENINKSPHTATLTCPLDRRALMRNLKHVQRQDPTPCLKTTAGKELWSSDVSLSAFKVLEGDTFFHLHVVALAIVLSDHLMLILQFLWIMNVTLWVGYIVITFYLPLAPLKMTFSL